MINQLSSLLIFWFVCVPFRLVEAGLLAKGPSWGTKFPQLPPELISCSVILADKDVETHLRNRVKNLWEVRSVQAANCLHCVLESIEEKIALKRYRCLNVFSHPYILINISECFFSLNPSLLGDSNLVNPSQLCLLSSRPKICNDVLSLHIIKYLWLI